jgi:hypothetical protein
MVKKAGLFVIAFLSVAAVLGFVVANPFGGAASDRGEAPGSAASRDAAVGMGESSGGGTVIAELGAVAPDAAPMVDTAVSELPGLPALGQPVVKTADLSVEVDKGAFGDAFDRASLVASRYGGYVEASSMAGAEARSGTLTIRVPSARFDDAMSDLRSLGVVTGESVSGRVVSQDFIDLDARLRTWEAQESVLLGLMDQATSIDATLRIQRELQDVQFRIEQIKGELRVLEDQTSLATIRLSMVESGVPIALEQKTEDTRPSLAEAWEKAVDGFLGVAYATVVGLGYLVPLTILGLVVWFGFRRFARRPETTGTAA